MMSGFSIKNLLAGSLLLTLLVFAYNCWSFMCGRSTVTMLLDLGPTAIALILCNILAVLILMLIKTCRTQGDGASVCSCGKRLDQNGWMYCPQCGQSVSL